MRSRPQERQAGRAQSILPADAGIAEPAQSLCDACAPPGLLALGRPRAAGGWVCAPGARTQCSALIGRFAPGAPWPWRRIAKRCVQAGRLPQRARSIAPGEALLRRVCGNANRSSGDGPSGPLWRTARFLIIVPRPKPGRNWAKFRRNRSKIRRLHPDFVRILARFGQPMRELFAQLLHDSSRPRWLATLLKQSHWAGPGTAPPRAARKHRRQCIHL